MYQTRLLALLPRSEAFLSSLHANTTTTLGLPHPTQNPTPTRHSPEMALPPIYSYRMSATIPLFCAGATTP